jgi:hypothetical protein
MTFKLNVLVKFKYIYIYIYLCVHSFVQMQQLLSTWPSPSLPSPWPLVLTSSFLQQGQPSSPIEPRPWQLRKCPVHLSCHSLINWDFVCFVFVSYAQLRAIIKEKRKLPSNLKKNMDTPTLLLGVMRKKRKKASITIFIGQRMMMKWRCRYTVFFHCLLEFRNDSEGSIVQTSGDRPLPLGTILAIQRPIL